MILETKKTKNMSKYFDKSGPIKATVPISSVIQGNGTFQNLFGKCSLLPVLPSSARHISPEHTVLGHRSPVTGNTEATMRRTLSLDTIYMRPTSNNSMMSTSVLYLDKSTQTDENDSERKDCEISKIVDSCDKKFEKVLRQRRQRSQRCENSVSSQTFGPPGKASPMVIPQRSNPHAIRPMRSSVEGLNQEIEKLILYKGQQNLLNPPDFEALSKTPEGHRAPLAELFHNQMRSVNTQTPIGDISSSEDSQSTSPETGSYVANASPRINRFLARAPPDGCEKVLLKQTETDKGLTAHFKPCEGFQLRPSLGSAFKLLQPVSSIPSPETSPSTSGATVTGTIATEEDTIEEGTDATVAFNEEDNLSQSEK